MKNTSQKSNKGLHISPLIIVIFVISSFFSYGCQSKTVNAAPSPKLAQKGLSDDSKRLYYYLVLTDALAQRDTAAAYVALQELLVLDPSVEVYQDAGTITLSSLEFNATTKLMHEGLEKYPNDEVLTLLLAASYSESDNVAKAKELLTSFLVKKPKSPKIVQELIRLYLQDGETAKASKIIDALPIEASPQSAYFHARIYTANKQYEKAKSVLLQHAKLKPNDPDVWVELGLLAETQNQFPAAIGYYKKAINLTPANVSIAARAVTLLIRSNNVKEIASVLQLTKANPEFILQTAIELSEKGFPQEAQALAAEAYAKNPNNAETAYYLSVFIYDTTSDPQKALVPLEKIAADSPLYVHALERKARLSIALKKFSEAVTISQEGKAKFPDNLVFYELEAYALTSSGNIPEARKQLEAILTKFPANEDMQFTLASLEDEAGNKDKALTLMEAIIAKNPKNAKALNYVGYTLAEKGKDLQRALALLTTATQEAPNAAYILDSLAWAQYQLGMFKEAWESIQKCMEIGIDEAAVWEHYGDIAVAVKNNKAAIKGYTEALQRKPDNAGAITQKLNKIQK